MSEWQPIETCPSYENVLLVGRDARGAIGMAIGTYDARVKIFRWPWMQDMQPTHWMPLPHPPTVNAGATDSASGKAESA